MCIQQENNSTRDTIFNVNRYDTTQLSCYVTKNKPQEQVKNITKSHLELREFVGIVRRFDSIRFARERWIFNCRHNPWFLRLYTLMKIRTYCHVIGYRKTQAAVAGSLSSLATNGTIWRANLFLRMWKKKRMKNAASAKELPSLHGLVNNRHKICMHEEGFETERDRKSSNFSGQKPWTRTILGILQSFVHFLKAKDINSCLK